jgi:hypothetical protein
MTRYQVNTAGLESENAVALFRGLLRWAAWRGDRFEIGCETQVYNDAAQLARLRALGEVSKPAPAGDVLSRFLKRKFDENFITIHGVPGPAFVEEMTRVGAPEQVIVGEESPVDTVIISDGTRAFYVAYDYGTVQILELADEEKAEAIRQLESLGHSAEILLPITSNP